MAKELSRYTKTDALLEMLLASPKTIDQMVKLFPYVRDKQGRSIFEGRTFPQAIPYSHLQAQERNGNVFIRREYNPHSRKMAKFYYLTPKGIQYVLRRRNLNELQYIR